METRETRSSMMTQTPDRAGQQAARIHDAVMALEALACATSMHVGGANDYTAKAFRAFFRAAAEALAAGMPPARLLAELSRDPDDDAPAPAPAPPAWAEYLPMTVDEFDAAGATLEVFIRPMQLTLWLGPGAAPAWAAGTGQVWDARRMTAELAAANVPEPEWTIDRLVKELGAEIRAVRTAQAVDG